MINPEKKITLDEYLEILRRRMWYIIIPFILIFAGASIYTIIAPREYKASTLVLVTPQSVPENLVQATVTSKVAERLQSIEQEVTSRTRLETIITEFRLYEKKHKNLPKEEMVELMRKNIKVELPTKRDEKGGFFSISFINDNPNIAAAVTNRLSSLFIEENLKIREQQASGTTEFLTNELTVAKAKLDQMETSVTNYKRRFMGGLPEQRDTNLKILEQMQMQNQRISESLRAAQDRKLFIQKQLSDMEMPASIPAAAGEGKDSQYLNKPFLTQKDASSVLAIDAGGTYDTKKDKLKRELEDLRTKYTDNHPDVIAVNKKLAKLEKNKDTYDNDIKSDPRYKELKNQLMTTSLEIKRLQNESASISAQVNKYLGRIEQTPAREQDMAGLLREYDSTKKAYESLLNKSQGAQQAENLEKRQKGEQFKVIDPARIPEKPFTPDVPKILLIGLFAGLAGGLALAFIREQMDRSFHDAADVELSLGIKVLATIPKIEAKAS
jgi:polysaccharide chain length determinant protein (PEP-CTERM system associated)